MRFIVNFSCAVILLCVFSSPVFSKQLTPIEIEKQLLEKKFNGFYKRVEAKKAYKKKRLKNVSQHKLQQKRYNEKAKKLRKKFIKKRNKKKKKEVDIDALVEKEQKKRERERAKKRVKYIQRKKVMAKLLETTKKIPEEVNVGLKSLEEAKKK